MQCTSPSHITTKEILKNLIEEPTSNFTSWGLITCSLPHKKRYTFTRSLSGHTPYILVFLTQQLTEEHTKKLTICELITCSLPLKKLNYIFGIEERPYLFCKLQP